MKSEKPFRPMLSPQQDFKEQYVKGLLIPFNKRALWVHLYPSYTPLYRDNWVAAW